MGRSEVSELDRIRAEYARREGDPKLRDLYSPLHPDVQFTAQTRERAVLRMLDQAGYGCLENSDLLEVGCGDGGVLLDLLRWGAEPARIHGCDLLSWRTARARQRLPASTTIAVADGGALPYPDCCFDLVLQFTVFTSILDDGLRRRVAHEMWRVLRAGGAILSYDFRLQGHNPALRAMHPREVRELFPDGRWRARRVILAPPITRRLARWSWLACQLLQAIAWLRSHDLVLIRKPAGETET